MQNFWSYLCFNISFLTHFCRQCCVVFLPKFHVSHFLCCLFSTADMMSASESLSCVGRGKIRWVGWVLNEFKAIKCISTVGSPTNNRELSASETSSQVYSFSPISHIIPLRAHTTNGSQHSPKLSRKARKNLTIGGKDKFLRPKDVIIQPDKIYTIVKSWFDKRRISGQARVYHNI